MFVNIILFTSQNLLGNKYAYMLICRSKKTVYVSYQFHWNTHMGITERRHEFNINCAKKADGTYTRDYSNLTKLQRQKNNISAHLAFAFLGKNKKGKWKWK